MKTFLLGVQAPINGIYLNSETIELLSIIQCKNIEELKNFALNCSQLNISEQNISLWDESNIEELKRMLVEQYKSTLIPLKQRITDRRMVLESTLAHSGIPEEEIYSYIQEFQTNGYDGIKKRLKEEHPREYGLLAEKAHRFISSERDQMTDVTYEELSGIDNILSNHNTILVASGRYYDVTKKLYNSQIPEMGKYDFYYPKRGLDFCYRNGMMARYHTLLDKQTMEEHLIGKPKEEVLQELTDYVKQSIDFITEYNKSHKIEGKGLISSVDLFNEIISFDPPYINMWQELYGISTEELISVFKYAQENKPEGVTYVYNEPFLENPERRQAVINQLTQIHNLAPGLIDTIGTQMHIDMLQDTDSIRKCFYDLKKLSELGIGTQITEFDMCLPERLMFDENGKLSDKYSPEFIQNFKTQKLQEISAAISETGIKLDGVTYWSISDTLDHNLERTNQKTYEKNLQRDVANTRYAGLYSGLERDKTFPTISMQAVVSNAIRQGATPEEIKRSEVEEQKALQEQQKIGVTKDE